MRLDLRDVIHNPDAKKDFQLQVDLSDLDFYGDKSIVQPVLAQGSVTNHAGALVLEGTARSVLDLHCDRCGKLFSREKVVELDSLVAQELEDDENDEIILLEGTELDLDEVVTTALSLRWIPKIYAQTTAKGCAQNAESTSTRNPAGANLK